MSDEATNKTDRKLARAGDRQTLSAVVGDSDTNDLDVFGYQVIYTTGEFVVDADRLREKAREFGVPMWMLPGWSVSEQEFRDPATRPHNAFGYAIKDLLDGRDEVEWEDQRVRFVLDKNDSRYSYSLDARVFFPPEMTTSDDGEWVQQRLGVIRYNNPDGGEPCVEFIDRVNADDSLAPLWGIDANGQPDRLSDYDGVRAAVNSGSLRARMEALFERHKHAYRGKDINNMTYYLVDQWTDAIRLRDAAYIVPANHTYRVDDDGEQPIIELVDAFGALYAWLDENAEKPQYAQPTEMNVVEIMDTERQRQMVERKASEKLQGMAEDMAETVVDRLQDDDVVASQVATEVGDTLDNLRAVAGEYDDLLGGGRNVDLKTQNAVERAVGTALDDLADEESELVAEVLDEADAPAVEVA